MGAVKKLFSPSGEIIPKAPKADTAELERIKRSQQEELREKDSEIAERKLAKRRLNSGRASLLSGAETGIPQRTTMG